MPYDSRYELDLLRGTEEPRPWNLIEIIEKYARKTDILLDIGCGTAFKLIQLADKVAKIYGIEPNKEMRIKAEENIGKERVSNIVLIEGKSERIPFESNYFDIVTCMVAPHITAEVHRILKPNGYAILEKIGDRDKWNFKQEFGSDDKGYRGQFSDLPDGERERIYEKEFGELFSEVSVQNGFWRTYYTMSGLVLLLEQTPAIRGYDTKNDIEILDKIKRKYSTARGIETTQNRILIIARK